jgi:peptide/nickel transport system substrate-binding protein
MKRQRRYGHEVSRRGFLQWVGTATGGLLLAACAAPPPAQAPPTTPSAPTPEATPVPAGQPMYGGKLRWAMTREPAGAFDPHLAVGSTGWYNHWVYESLVDVDADYANLIPRLAESWEPEEGGQVWVFHLRQGVKFHHGREFNADDVLFNFERMLDPDFGSSALVILKPIQDVEKVDDYTVRFALEAANADFPLLLTAWQARMVPSDLTDEQIEREPRGTGPFRIDQYAHADRIPFYRNEEYWMEGRPYLDQVEFVYIPEPTTLANALRAGEVEVYHEMPSQIIEELQDEPGIVITPSVPVDLHEIYMRLDMEPFNDDRVRRAFKLIGDRVAMTEIAWPNVAAQPDDDNPVVPTSSFRIDTNIWQQDLEEARRLISEAGYEDGLEVTLWAINDIPGILDFSLAFADWAKQAGVTVNLEGVKADPYYADQWMQVPFGTVGWSGRVSVDEQLRIAYQSEAAWNETRYQNPEFDRMLDEARAETDTEKRSQLYAELQRMLIEEGGQIIPYHYPKVSGVRSRVHGYKPHPLSGLDPRLAWLEG